MRDFNELIRQLRMSGYIDPLQAEEADEITKYRRLYEAESAEVQSLNQQIERLEARIRRAADSSTDPVVARDLREALSVSSQDRA